MIRIISLLLPTFILCSPCAKASSSFIGYEFGQMAFNGFKHYAGEIGYNLPNNSSIRFSFLNVALSERHLSSNESSAVDGDNVEGLWRGGELLYDYPLLKRFFIGGSVGYYDSEYSHTILNESVRQASPTVSLALSYKEESLFNIPNTYLRLSLSYRHYFNPIPETLLGESIVSGDSGEITPIVFIGLQFD